MSADLVAALAAAVTLAAHTHPYTDGCDCACNRPSLGGLDHSTLET